MGRNKATSVAYVGSDHRHLKSRWSHRPVLLLRSIVWVFHRIWGALWWVLRYFVFPSSVSLSSAHLAFVPQSVPWRLPRPIPCTLDQQNRFLVFFLSGFQLVEVDLLTYVHHTDYQDSFLLPRWRTLLLLPLCWLLRQIRSVYALCLWIYSPHWVHVGCTAYFCSGEFVSAIDRLG